MENLKPLFDAMASIGSTALIIIAVLTVLLIVFIIICGNYSRINKIVSGENIKLEREYRLVESQRKSLQEKNERLSNEKKEVESDFSKLIEVNHSYMAEMLKKQVRTRNAKGQFEKKNK